MVLSMEHSITVPPVLPPTVLHACTQRKVNGSVDSKVYPSTPDIPYRKDSAWNRLRFGLNKDADNIG
jgi:hypothetical protein